MTHPRKIDRLARAMNTLLAFYYGGAPDDRGRLLAEITRQDDLWLEVTHDYVQWLFPLREMSRVTPWAPVVDNEVLAAFLDDELLRTHLMVSFLRMLSFYGLAQKDGRIVKGENWEERKDNWFTQGTHNDLRITRIIKCLTLLGLRPVAEQFHATLVGLRESESDCGIGETAFRYWLAALDGAQSGLS
jgi:hypothetical protein